MLINIPNQLTSEEEQLLKKIAKMKKKKKQFIEKKTSSKDSQQDSQTANTNSSSAVKRNSTGTSNVKQPQIDAKEAAKKLIQSGVIKLETENKDKGFKRSCSRKDDARKMSFNHQESFDSSKATYSSFNTPMSAKSPPFSPGSNPFFNANKFSSSDSNSSNPSQYTRSPSFNSNNNQNNNFRRNSFQHNYNNNQTPISGGNNNNNSNNNTNMRFHNNNYHHHGNNNNQNNNNNHNQNGFSLYVKANNVNEDLLRSIFNANVSNAKIISIDVKTNFAFVMVDSKEAAENAIQELNGKTFQDSLYSVSHARPKKQFNRNNSYQQNFERSNSFNSNNMNNNNNNNMNNNNGNFNTSNNSEFSNQGGTGPSSRNSSLSPAVHEQQPPQPSNAQRPVINYEDI